jgi:hypothetical protein
MSIINFSNHTFKVEKIANLKVSDLVQLAEQNQPRLFVVHDPVIKASAVVIPDLALKVIRDLGLPPEHPATDVGLMGALRGRQITVKADQAANTVAKIARLSKAEFVIVTDHERTPTGLFIPNVVTQRLPQASMVHEHPGLELIIRQRIAENDLTGAIAQVEKRIKDFHSEKVNLDAPDPYICSGDDEDGPHHRNACPCPYHPGAACSKREVLTGP